ncbi:MAG: hypothetical protein JWN10_1665 [Solirubrobacterales bacterium]|nr:hypothetical protein [Solirubrobacterales bacterium]
MTLQQRDLDVLEALRHDRDECGDGVEIKEVARLGATRWPDRVIKRLRAHGFVIGFEDDCCRLGHDEPDLQRAECKPEVVIRRLDAAQVRLRAARDGEDAQLTIDVGPPAPRSWAEAA